MGIIYVLIIPNTFVLLVQQSTPLSSFDVIGTKPDQTETNKVPSSSPLTHHNLLFWAISTHILYLSKSTLMQNVPTAHKPQNIEPDAASLV